MCCCVFLFSINFCLHRELEEARHQQELEKEFEEQVNRRKEAKENLRKRKQNTKAPEKTDADLKGYSQIQARELTEDDAVKPVTQKVRLSRVLQ